MSDTRPIESFRFGLEWAPKLAEMMLRFPWPDSAFVAGDPSAVCKKCGGGKTSQKHVFEMTVSLIRPSEIVEGAHGFEPSEPFSEEKIASARDEWRRRMANLPTPEAEGAWKVVHQEKFKRLHELFTKCDIKTREDIENLGCTGCYEHGVALDDIKFLRIGLAGSGVGLPCFVPPDRYCLAHEVSGGLQDGQGQRFAHRVEQVARPLTAAETAHAKLVQAARKSEREYGAHSMLHGHTLPPGWEETMDGADGGAQVETFQEPVQHPIVVKPWDDLAATMSPERRAAVQARVDAEVGKIQDRLWKCTEHDKIVWKCRHCIAQAVVEGELTPVLEVRGAVNTSDPSVEGIVAAAETQNVDRVEVWACVASFTRKLARD